MRNAELVNENNFDTDAMFGKSSIGGKNLRDTSKPEIRIALATELYYLISTEANVHTEQPLRIRRLSLKPKLCSKENRYS